MSHVTVRNRIEALVSSEVIEIRAVANPKALEFPSEVIIGIRAELSSALDLAEALTGLEEVTFVAVVTGRYDLLMGVALRSEQELLSFLSSKLAKFPAVKDTETFHILSYRKRRAHWKVPRQVPELLREP